MSDGEIQWRMNPNQEFFDDDDETASTVISIVDVCDKVEVTKTMHAPAWQNPFNLSWGDWNEDTSDEDEQVPINLYIDDIMLHHAHKSVRLDENELSRKLRELGSVPVGNLDCESDASIVITEAHQVRD